MKKKIGVHLAHGNKRSVKTRKSSLADRIITLVEEAKRKVVSAVNVALVYTYYEVGRMIVEEEQGGKKRAQYGKAQLQALSKKLTERFGKGWSVENLKLMRRLFLVYSQENQNAVLENSPNSVNPVYPIGDTANVSQAKMANYVYEIKKEPYLPEENPTIGILLCADKNDAIVEMTLPQGSKRIFASKYMTVLPDKETLRLLVRKQLGGEK